MDEGGSNNLDISLRGGVYFLLLSTEGGVKKIGLFPNSTTPLLKCKKRLTP